MVRVVAAFSIVLAGVVAVPAEAGQSSSSFRVGLTIGGARVKSGRMPMKRLKSYTWNAAAISVRHAGFQGVVRVKTSSGVYWFEAEREGRRYRIAVSARNGGILRVFVARS